MDWTRASELELGENRAKKCLHVLPNVQDQLGRAQSSTAGVPRGGCNAQV